MFCQNNDKYINQGIFWGSEDNSSTSIFLLFPLLIFNFISAATRLISLGLWSHCESKPFAITTTSWHQPLAPSCAVSLSEPTADSRDEETFSSQAKISLTSLTALSWDILQSYSGIAFHIQTQMEQFVQIACIMVGGRLPGVWVTSRPWRRGSSP